MKFLPKTLAAAAGSAALLALAVGVNPVQAQQQTEQPTQQPEATPELDDATLKAFAQASLDVEEVANEWRSRIQSAEESEAEQLRNQANQEIVQAVQSNGLEVQTYTQIYQIAQADPDVATKIQQYRQQMQ